MQWGQGSAWATELEQQRCGETRWGTGRALLRLRGQGVASRAKALGPAAMSRDREGLSQGPGAALVGECEGFRECGHSI